MYYQLTSLLLLALLLLAFSSYYPLFAATVTANASVTVMNTKLNLNQASIEQLAAIRGINHHAAREIIEYRQENDGFINLNELTKIRGIGPSTLRKIVPFLTL